MAPDSALLTYEQVAERLAVSVRMVRRLVARKQLKAVVFGHSTVRFRPADVDRMVARLAGDRREGWP